MMCQMFLYKYLLTCKGNFDPNIIRWTCIGRVLCRVFGLNSGCVALVMAMERWLALTKPFTYQQYVTKRFLGTFIFGLWFFSTVWTCLPFTGFGLYYDEAEQRCVRYRSAREYHDIAYAYTMFTLGMLFCIGIVIFNLSVTKVLCQAHYSRHSSGSSNSLFHHQVNIRKMTKALFHLNNEQGFYNNIPSTEEIRFAKLMLFLSLSFVLFWSPQMVRPQMIHILL